jgi:serine/threonine-protein kinase
MPSTNKPDPARSSPEEEQLAQLLVSRGLVTRDEVQQCMPVSDGETLLRRLAQAGFLTPGQAKRLGQELPSLREQPIPGYQLLEKLGQGAMGIVYKARQLSMNRLVAVKVLHPRRVTKPKYLERLVREAHTAARLSHNNIVQAIDVGSAGNLHYFVMEYVEGTTLKQELERREAFEEREAIEIALQIAQALQHAQRRGLIHRDVKPANIILTPEGTAKLADLGMARDTADSARAQRERGVTMGTPYYMAPEQVEGRENIDVRADIYALGATLYHLVTGQPPFPGDDPEEIFAAHLHRELTPPDHINTSLSAGIGEVVELMMAKNRNQRYRTPDDVIIDLECLLNDEPPRMARQRIERGTLESLAEGVTDEDEREEEQSLRAGNPMLWVGILGGLLAASVVLNVVLFLLRR